MRLAPLVAALLVLAGGPALAGSRACMEGAGERVRVEGRIYAVGDHVVIKRRAGTFKSADTGRWQELEAGQGQTGTIGCFAASPVTGRAELGVVDWDAQDWQTWHRETGVSTERIGVRAFRAAIHLSYLRVTGP